MNEQVKVQTIVVDGKQIDIEQRECCNCKRLFKASLQSDQLTCSHFCGEDGIKKSGWQTGYDRSYSAMMQRRRLRSQQNLASGNVKVDQKLVNVVKPKANVIQIKADLPSSNLKLEVQEATIAAAAIIGKSIIDDLEIFEPKVVKSKDKQRQAIASKVDQLTPTEDEIVHQRWLSYVARAKKIVKQMNHSRFDIADLAIAACDVRHGGGAHWSKFAGIHTLKDFAREAGVHYKTLHGWCRVRTLVRPAIPDEEWSDQDWGAAIRTLNKISKQTPAEQIREKYNRERKRLGVGIQMRTFIKRMSHIRHFLDTTDLKKFDREDLDELHALCNDVGTRVQDFLGKH